MGRVLILFLIILGLAAPSYAQVGAFVRLQQVPASGTVASTSDFVILNAVDVGGFGTIKVQTVDSYTGTWEIQCTVSPNNDWDAAVVLQLKKVDSSTIVTEVVDEVGIWDVVNAAGCYRVRFAPTAGFSGTETEVWMRATQTGGAGSGGGGGGVASTVAISQSGTDNDVDATVSFTLTETDDGTIAGSQLVDAAVTLGYFWNGSAWVRTLGNATDGQLVNLGSNNDVTITSGTVTANIATFAIGGVTGTLFDLTNSNPLATQIVDANGDAITSFGGGTQYTEGVTDASITGNALLFEGATDTLVAAPGTAANGLLVDVSRIQGSIDVSATSNGLDLATEATLAEIDVNTDGLEGSVDGLETLSTAIQTSVDILATAIYPDDDDFTNDVSTFIGIGGVRMDTPDTVTDGDWGVLRINSSHELMVAGSFTADLVDTAMDPITEDGANAIRAYLVTGAGVGINVATVYTEDVAFSTDPEGGPVLLRRDNDLSNTVSSEDDPFIWGGNSRGAGWVDIDPGGTLGAKLVSSLVTEDDAETSAGSILRVGAVVRSTASGSSATAGDNASFNVDPLGRLWTRDGDPCADPARILSTAISESTAATNEIVALSGSNLIYVCSYKWVTTLANSIQWKYGTGTDCNTGTTSIEGAQPFGANGGVVESGAGHTLFVVPAGNALCTTASAATALGGRVSYVSTAAP